jgi:hypothetical protein
MTNMDYSRPARFVTSSTREWMLSAPAGIDAYEDLAGLVRSWNAAPTARTLGMASSIETLAMAAAHVDEDGSEFDEDFYALAMHAQSACDNWGQGDG